jgi:energy-coupling factor transporter transmembrane protein EcfT
VRFQPAYPEIREWLRLNPIGLAGLIILFLLVSWVVGRVRLEKRFIEEWIPFLLLILIFSICLASLPQLFTSLAAYQLRAQLWDWRDAQIHNAILRGNYEIELPALDSIAGVTELQADPGHWVNNCAELYYGMKSISAVPPVLTSVPGDEPTQ